MAAALVCLQHTVTWMPGRVAYGRPTDLWQSTISGTNFRAGAKAGSLGFRGLGSPIFHLAGVGIFTQLGGWHQEDGIGRHLMVLAYP